MRKAIFFDWDGTLSVANNELSEGNKAALHKAKQQGHLLFLCTGRGYALVPKHAIEELGFDGIVCAAGCYILIGDKLIFHNTVSEEILEEIYLHFLKDGQFCFLEGEEELFMINVEESLYPSIHRLQSPEDFDRYLSGRAISKLTMRGEMSEETKELLSKYFTLIIHPDYQEAIPIGYNKATGIQKVLDFFDMEQKDSVAIGDSANDLDMLRYAGISIVMENAPEEVKKEADFISCRAEDDGVAEALNRWICNKS